MAREAPDVVLLDHELAGLDGMAVLDRLRADDALAAVPVIMLDATASDPRAADRGAATRCATTICAGRSTLAELDARVMAALRVKRLHDALAGRPTGGSRSRR